MATIECMQIILYTNRKCSMISKGQWMDTLHCKSKPRSHECTSKSLLYFKLVLKCCEIDLHPIHSMINVYI